MDELSQPPSHSPVPPPAARRSSRLPIAVMILLALLFVMVLPRLAEEVQYALTRGQLRARSEMAVEQLQKLSDSAELVKLSDTSRAFRLVAHRVEPSVVHIDTVTADNGVSGVQFDEWGFHSPRQGGRRRTQGQGTGVIVDEQGYIVTNYHVVQNAEAISVRLSDGRTINHATLVGHDVLTDLAVLKVDADNLISATWGDSEALEVGDWVLAIGSPYGLDRSVTSGIVSAKQRRGVAHHTPYQDFLQTDAAVNPGNSGGPLVNIRGEIVGINTAIVGQSYQGISFAIPSAIARDVYQRLVATGQVARGWLGVGLQEVTVELSKQLGLDEPAGALVSGVQSGSPAEEAGMQAGDVVVKWNGQEIHERTELTLLVARTEVGSKVTAVVIRDGKKINLEITVGERPDEDQLRR